MNKKIPVIAGIIIIASIVGIISVLPDVQTNSTFDPDDPDGDDHIKKTHDYVWSGPLGVTQYEHRLGEDVFLVVRDLQPNEKGTIGVFTPQGVLYKTIPYDGSIKPNFNNYFYPDTFAKLDICTPEELVGIWKIVFANDAYPTLEFKMSDEYLPGSKSSITTVC